MSKVNDEHNGLLWTFWGKSKKNFMKGLVSEWLNLITQVFGFSRRIMLFRNENNMQKIWAIYKQQTHNFT